MPRWVYEHSDGANRGEIMKIKDKGGRGKGEIHEKNYESYNNQTDFGYRERERV